MRTASTPVDFAFASRTVLAVSISGYECLISSAYDVAFARPPEGVVLLRERLLPCARLEELGLIGWRYGGVEEKEGAVLRHEEDVAERVNDALFVSR